MAENRVFVLGLDGATFDVIDPMVRKGELPHFKQVLECGVRGQLLSTIPPNSASAWTSLVSGKNSGKHSILGFTRKERNSYSLRFVSGKDNTVEAIWERLGDHGKNSIVINVPMTYPPKPIHGLLVSGLDTPGLNTQFTYPPQLKEEVFRVAEDYKINLALGGYLYNDKRRKNALRMIFSSIEARKKVVLHLMKNYPWDFFLVRFNDPDTTQHHFWKYMDENHPLYHKDTPEEFKSAIHMVYKKLDQVLASILMELKLGDTLIVVSDHGGGSRINKAIYVNEWLQSQGYLDRLSDSQKESNYSLSSVNQYRLMEKALEFALRRLSPQIKGSLRRRFPGLASKTATYFKLSGINWKKTRAFVGEVESIRINRKGDYPFGIVGDDYEELRESIITDIKKLRDPDTGETVIEEAFRREEIFSGPQLKVLPDLILVSKENKYDISWKFFDGTNKSHPVNNYVRKQEHWRSTSGMHRKYGIFIMQGPFVKRDTETEGMTIYDVMPTILYRMGFPIPENVDGKVITELFADDFIKNNPVKYKGVQESNRFIEDSENTYSEKEEEIIKEFLKGMGYIE